MKQTQQEYIEELEQRITELENQSNRRAKELVATYELIEQLNNRNDDYFLDSPQYKQMQRELKYYKATNETLTQDVKRWKKRSEVKAEIITKLEMKCDDLQVQLESKTQVRTGSLNPDGRPRKLKGEQEQAVKQFWNDTKVSYKEIAEHFNISAATVCRIIKRRTKD